MVDRELRVYEGLIWRRTRAIPLERLQSVELVRLPLARIFGMAELRLEVVGGGKTEAPLAYLPAAPRPPELRTGGCSSLSRRVRPAPAGAAAHAAAAGAPAPRRWTAPGRPLHAVTQPATCWSASCSPRRRSCSRSAWPSWWSQFLSEGSWSFVAVASTLTAMAGVLLQPVRRVLDDWNFRLARDGRHGCGSATACWRPGRRPCRWTGCRPSG